MNDGSWCKVIGGIRDHGFTCLGLHPYPLCTEIPPNPVNCLMIRQIASNLSLSYIGLKNVNDFLMHFLTKCIYFVYSCNSCFHQLIITSGSQLTFTWDLFFNYYYFQEKIRYTQIKQTEFFLVYPFAWPKLHWIICRTTVQQCFWSGKNRKFKSG